jgi:hypothetical protein
MDFHFSLLENGLDFVLSSLEHLTAASAQPRANLTFVKAICDGAGPIMQNHPIKTNAMPASPLAQPDALVIRARGEMASGASLHPGFPTARI